MESSQRVFIILTSLITVSLLVFNLLRLNGVDMPVMPWQGEVSAAAGRSKLGHPELLDFSGPVKEMIIEEVWNGNPRKRTITISQDSLQATVKKEAENKLEVTTYQVKGDTVEISKDGSLIARATFSGLCLAVREDFRSEGTETSNKKCDDLGRPIFWDTGYMQEKTVWSLKGRKSVSQRHTKAFMNVPAKDSELTGYYDRYGNVTKGFGDGMFAEMRYKYDSRGNWTEISTEIPLFLNSSSEPQRRQIFYY